MREARDLFPTAMEQLSVDVPRSRQEAVRFSAAEIINGYLSLYEGARPILLHGYVELGCPDELLPFGACPVNGTTIRTTAPATRATS